MEQAACGQLGGRGRVAGWQGDAGEQKDGESSLMAANQRGASGPVAAAWLIGSGFAPDGRNQSRDSRIELQHDSPRQTRPDELSRR